MVNELGNAEGRIGLNVRAYIRDARQITRASKQAGDDIADSFDKGTREASQKARRNLDVLKDGIVGVREEALGIAAVGGALTGFGLQAADNIRVLRTRFEELTGSQEAAEKLMDRIAKNARDFNLPVRQAQKDFLGLVPAVQSANEDLDEYFGLTARLATLNKDEGTSGAIFAIREALASGGTDLVSLSERFNIPRKQLRSLIEETGSFSTALDQILDDYGATTKAAQAQAKSLSGLGARYRDLATRTLEKAFAPALDGVLTQGENLLETLENLPDPIVQIGGAMTIATTGIAAGTAALSGFVSVAQGVRENLPAIKSGLRAAGSIGAKGAKLAGKGGLLAGAGAAGVAGGIGLVRLTGQATGNERLANFGIKDAAETARQGIFLFVNLLIESGRRVALFLNETVVAIQAFPDKIALQIANLQIIFGRLEQTVGQIINSIGARLGNQSLADSGTELFVRGNQRTLEATFARDDALGRIDERRQQNQDAINAAFDDIQRGVARGFGVIKDETEEGVDEVEQAATPISDAFKNVVGQVQSEVQKRIAELVESFDDRVQFEQELLDLQESSPDAINNRIQALRNEQEAIEKMLPRLEAAAPASEDAAEKLAEYRDRLDQISQRLPRFADVLEQATAGALGDVADERAKEIADAQADADKELLELEEDTSDKRAELREDERDAFDEFRESQTEARQEYYKKLNDIREQSERDAILARSKLDAAGLASVIQKAREERNTAQERLNEQRSENQSRLNEQQQSLSKELGDLATYYQEREQVILNNEQQELNKINAKYDKEEQLLQSQLNRQLQAVESAQNQELNIRQFGFSQLLSGARDFANDLLGIGRDLSEAETKIADSVNNASSSMANMDDSTALRDALAGYMARDPIAARPSQITNNQQSSSRSVTVEEGAVQVSGVNDKNIGVVVLEQLVKLAEEN